jgi:hypothetical protein
MFLRRTSATQLLSSTHEGNSVAKDRGVGAAQEDELRPRRGDLLLKGLLVFGSAAAMIALTAWLLV